MKNQIVLLCWLFAVGVTNGQNKQPFIYTSIAAGGGTHNTFQWSLETVFEHKHHLSLSYFSTNKNASNIPEDYKGGLNLKIFSADNLPDVNSYTIAFMYGRVIPTHSQRIRFVLGGGIGVSATNRPVDFIKVDKPGLFAANYYYSTKKSSSLSLVFAPKVEFPLLRFVGFSTGPVAAINNQDPSFGWVVALSIGLLRHN